MKKNKLLIRLIAVIAMILPMLFLSTSCTGQAAIPKEVTKYAKDCPLANKDYSNTRSSFSSSINSGKEFAQ